jgi:hypothetical protein
MDEEVTIVYLNNQEKITKFFSESNLVFNQRIEIIRLMEKDNIKWKEAHKLSKIWYNIKFNNAKYNSDLYKKYLHYENLSK